MWRNSRNLLFDRIFYVWLEDWEKDLPQSNDCVAESWCLENYRDWLFLDHETKKTFKLWGDNLEFQSGGQKNGVTKGW